MLSSQKSCCLICQKTTWRKKHYISYHKVAVKIKNIRGVTNFNFSTNPAFQLTPVSPTWSAVCSEAPHSQFGEGARPHLCMDKWNRPTPVRRRLSLTQVARGKPIPTGPAINDNDDDDDEWPHQAALSFNHISK